VDNSYRENIYEPLSQLVILFHYENRTTVSLHNKKQQIGTQKLNDKAI